MNEKQIREFNLILEGLQDNIEMLTQGYEFGEHVQAQNAAKTAEVTMKALVFIRNNMMREKTILPQPFYGAMLDHVAKLIVDNNIELPDVNRKVLVLLQNNKNSWVDKYN